MRCENMHLDCRIARMEQRISELEALSLEKSIVMHNQEQRISELEAERRWIPVGERLPKDGDGIAFYSPQFGVQFQQDFFEFDDVTTHWMPMPKPPEVK